MILFGKPKPRFWDKKTEPTLKFPNCCITNIYI